MANSFTPVRSEAKQSLWSGGGGSGRSDRMAERTPARWAACCKASTLRRLLMPLKKKRTVAHPPYKVLVDISGIRSQAAVALRKEDVLFGAIVVYRREVRAYTEKQIALLQNFAAQAV